MNRIEMGIPSSRPQLAMGMRPILDELCAIRELLEWLKADTLEQRAKRDQEEAGCMEAMLERQKAIVEELQDRQLERYCQELEKSRYEHEVLCHGRPRAQELTVQ